MGYIITVELDQSVSLLTDQSNKNKILFLNKEDLKNQSLSILERYSFILLTQNKAELSLETEKPLQELIDLLRDLNFLTQDIYEKIKGVLPAILADNQFYEAIKDYIVTDYSGDQIDYTTYSFTNQCLRSLATILTFPISIFRSHLVKEGEIGLVLRSGKSEILPPGWHVMLAPTTEFIGTRRIDEPYIQHGAMQLIRVQEGQLGYAKDIERGKHLFLKPGFHIIRSSNTQFIKFLDLQNEINELNPGWLVSIRTGTEGLVYNGGHLVMKKPGVHFIVPPSTLEKIISIQDTIMELPECTYESSDYVPLKVKADVFYRITDTQKVCEKIAPCLLEKYIHDTAIATLSSIIRNSTLNEIGQSSTPAYHASSSRTHPADLGATEQSDLGATASELSLPPPPYSFYSKVHDTFVQELQKHGIHELGVNIFNIRIESLSIKDPALAKNICSQALLYAQIQTKLANVEAENKIKEAVAQQEAKTRLIEAKAKAMAVTVEAEAGAQSIKVQAEAEAKAIQVKGQAENQILTGKWEALAKGGTAVEGHPTAQQAALILASVEQLKNIQKIVYLPADMTGIVNYGIFNRNRENIQSSGPGHLLPLNSEEEATAFAPSFN